MVFVVGATGPDAREKYYEQQEFMLKLFDTYVIGQKGMLPGLVTYGANTKLYINEVKDNVEAKYLFGNVLFGNVGKGVVTALQAVRNEILLVSSGARKGIAKTIVIFLDNKEQINDNTRKNIQLLEENNKVVIVGIGPNLSESDTKQLASDSTSVIYIQNIDELATKVPEVTKASIKGDSFDLTISVTVFIISEEVEMALASKHLISPLLFRVSLRSHFLFSTKVEVKGTIY